MESELNERLVVDPGGAFEALVHAYGQRMFAFAFAMSGNAADAEEVAQDTFVRADRALRSYDPDRLRQLALNAWLHRIALNVFRNRVRGRRPRVVPLDAELPVADGSPGPERMALARDELRTLAGLVSRLPDQQRAAIVLHSVQGLTYQEVGALLGQPEGTVKSNVHRGLAALRRQRELSEVS